MLGTLSPGFGIGAAELAVCVNSRLLKLGDFTCSASPKATGELPREADSWADRYADDDSSLEDDPLCTNPGCAAAPRVPGSAAESECTSCTAIPYIWYRPYCITCPTGGAKWQEHHRNHANCMMQLVLQCPSLL